MRRDARARVATESALRRAIERDELRLHVQPVIELASRRIQGFEGLVRWQHPERGLVPPGEFIPLAEETGLIVPIGEWVLREVCRALRHWHEDLGADWVQCSVNLSMRHLHKPDLVATVRDSLAESGLPGHRLILEITESAVVESPAGTRETLHALEALGVRLALDDFGTGYSSLARLHEFPFDILKVDRSFIAQLGDDGERASIAGAIVSLSRALGLGTCAEGIEDGAQLRAAERPRLTSRGGGLRPGRANRTRTGRGPYRELDRSGADMPKSTAAATAPRARRTRETAVSSRRGRRAIAHERIALRAYELHLAGAEGDPVEHWLRAERGLVGA